MALIQCRECGNQVSSTAAGCPKCGAAVPISGAVIGTPLTTTQLTSKRLKIHSLIAAVLFFGGLIWFFASLFSASAGESSGAGVGFGPPLILVGAIWGIVTKFRTWWHHG